MNHPVDVIVVGAGHAGLCVSYYLAKHEIGHIVFEQGRIGETWRSQRWDSFKMNSANKLNLLPEQAVYFDDPDAFVFANEFASSLKNYSKQLSLPVKEYCKVLDITKDEKENIFLVNVSEDGEERTYCSRQVVVASGGQNKIHVPTFAENISKSILQLHTSEYKNSNQLSQGDVLVVGSAQSGIQVAEDLVRAGKKVFLSTSKAGRIPRSYRGMDIFDWLLQIGFYDVYTEDIIDVSLLKTKNPQVSGFGDRGKTSSLQSLARSGVVILGRAESADLKRIFFQRNAALHVRYADEYSQKVKGMIDEHIRANSQPIPVGEIDPDDIPDEHADCASDLAEINFDDNNIKSIIWTTGFVSDFSYLKLPVLNEDKMPRHRHGISEVKGLYFIGLSWLRKRKSPIILGISEDAEFIVDQILESGLRS